jgi:demethylmenaquinone methyltransferase/2-methoxy-6-polyprenyl-1,4-benzoquinol methylase
MSLPSKVESATRSAADAGFALSCDPDAGRLLAVLSAAVPAGGSILELGTGAGVGLAWIVAGLGSRRDVSVDSVEVDAAVAAVAARNDWPGFVRVAVCDALEVMRRGNRWDLIFADAQGGKWEGLDETVDALRPGGVLLVDDMTPGAFVDDQHRVKTHEVRECLLGDERLVTVEISWSTGLILCSRTTE